jgi:ParB family chromosome partitioning protein
MMSHEEKIIEVEISRVKPDENYAGKHISEEDLVELAESIKENGIINPILVYEDGENYVIIAGTRRWLAAKKAGLDTVPVVIRSSMSGYLSIVNELVMIK